MSTQDNIVGVKCRTNFPQILNDNEFPLPSNIIHFTVHVTLVCQGA